MPGGKLRGNRTVIGIVCIVLALAVTFGVAPLVTRFTERKAEVVRIAADVKQGHQITAQDIETVNINVGAIPDGAIINSSVVVGMYAATDLYDGDFVFSGKLTKTITNAKDVMGSLDGTKVAVSVAIGSYAAGISGKIENGDIVSVMVLNKDENRTFIPPELQYVKVVTTTTQAGVDKNEVTDGASPATITFLVTAEQAQLLAQYNSTTSMHFVLVYRGDAETAAKYIEAQDTYLNSAKEGGTVNE